MPPATPKLTLPSAEPPPSLSRSHTTPAAASSLDGCGVPAGVLDDRGRSLSTASTSLPPGALGGESSTSKLQRREALLLSNLRRAEADLQLHSHQLEQVRQAMTRGRAAPATTPAAEPAACPLHPENRRSASVRRSFSVLKNTTLIAE